MIRRVIFFAAMAAVSACASETTTTTPPLGAANVALSLDPLALRAGDSLLPAVQVTIGDTVRAARPDEILVSSSDTGVIAVASNGALLGLTDGTSTVTVRWAAAPVVTATELVTVASEDLTHVDVTGPLSMIPGDTATFVVTGTTRFGRQVTQPASVTVISRNPSVVAATANLAIAVAPGTTWIVALASTGASDSSFVTVAVGAPTALVLSPHLASLTSGDVIPTSVTMTDRRGNAVTNVTPSYTSSDAGVASVNGSGLVTAAGAGTALIIASSHGVADTLHATVTAPVQTLASLNTAPSSVTLNPGDTVRIAVSALDTHGNAMPVPPVSWSSLTSGITVSSTGLITASSSITSAINNGIVRVTSSSVFAQVTVNVSVTSGGSDNGYVQIVWVGGTPSAPVAAAFEAARQRINGLFNSFAGVTAVNPAAPANYCLAGAPAVNQTVNGIVIFAQVTAIDGVGNILGSAGPCLLRNGTLLPIVAMMQFDSADMDAMVASGMLNGVVLHEMMHTLGFGTIWGPGQQDEVASPNGSDPRYAGTTGRAEYAALGASDAASGVPVENTGGSGTRGSHWRESVFNGELMTGWANGSMAMSRVTIGALRDFGYDVDLNKADPYTLGASLLAGASTPPLAIGEVTIKPIGVLGADGKITPYH